MNTKDNLFASALSAYGYLSQEKLDTCLREIAVRHNKGEKISLENYLLEKGVLSSAQITQVHSKITMSAADLEEVVRSKTMTFDGCINPNNLPDANHSFTIAPTPPPSNTSKTSE